MSEQLVRFLRAEMIARWPIHPDDIPCLDGSRVQITALLCDHLDFSRRRASAEVDEFFCELDARLRRATEMTIALVVSKPAAA